MLRFLLLNFSIYTTSLNLFFLFYNSLNTCFFVGTAWKTTLSAQCQAGITTINNPHIFLGNEELHVIQCKLQEWDITRQDSESSVATGEKICTIHCSEGKDTSVSSSGWSVWHNPSLHAEKPAMFPYFISLCHFCQISPFLKRYCHVSFVTTSVYYHLR